MSRRLKKLESKFLAVLLVAGPATIFLPVAAPANSAVPVAAAPAQGVIKQRSDYGFDETIIRIKGDIATKGIRFFDEIDQTKLGESAKLPINRSTLLLFGNPPLGVQFLQSNPVAGLDWPVRMITTCATIGDRIVAGPAISRTARNFDSSFLSLRRICQSPSK